MNSENAFFMMVREALHQEWVNCIYGNLHIRDEKTIPKPVFQFSDSMKVLGCWHSDGNVIELSRSLVTEHPWYAVCDVLYHEIAHQAVYYLYGPYVDEGPHGEKFRQVCHWLGANPAASSSNRELDVRVFGDENREEGSLIDKIRKLLLLAEKGEEHEAEVALAKAMEIMAKHGIRQDDLNDGQDFTTIAVGPLKKRRENGSGWIQQLLETFWDVRTLWVHEPILEGMELRYGMRLAISGTPEKVKIAAYVHDFIFQHITKEWLLYCEKSGVNSKLARMKNVFAIGVLRGLYSKLEQQVEQQNLQALVLVSNPRLENYFHRRYPHIRNHPSYSTTFDEAIHEAGQQVGRDTVIAPGLDNVGQLQNHALPPKK